MSATSNGRPIRAVTEDGVRLLSDLRTGERSLVAQHSNAVRTYLETGRTSVLKAFVGVTVGGYILETNPQTLDWWGHTGELAYDSIYGELT
jgi:hypothetical protein